VFRSRLKATLPTSSGAFSRWPDSPQVEAEVAAWFDAKTLDEEKTIVRRLNKAALDHVVFAPLRSAPLVDARGLGLVTAAGGLVSCLAPAHPRSPAALING
jgi:hypothetical protein